MIILHLFRAILFVITQLIKKMLDKGENAKTVQYIGNTILLHVMAAQQIRKHHKTFKIIQYTKYVNMRFFCCLVYTNCCESFSIYFPIQGKEVRDNLVPD